MTAHDANAVPCSSLVQVGWCCTRTKADRNLFGTKCCDYAVPVYVITEDTDCCDVCDA